MVWGLGLGMSKCLATYTDTGIYFANTRLSVPPRAYKKQKPMMWPDKISVYHKLSNEPPSLSSSDPGSFSTLNFDVVILSEKHQRPAARCQEDVVFYDYRIARKVKTVPQFMLEQFRHTWELQEEAKRANRLRVQGIEARVRALETASWDREDAVEDMGSAVSQ